MLEILYRIYEVLSDEDRTASAERNDKLNLYYSESRNNRELSMDCMICESRDHFKSMIKEMYGEDLKFQYRANMKPGQLYCIIIGEHCYTPEKYFSRTEFDCDYCKSHVISYGGYHSRISDSEIKYQLFNIQEYKEKKFCSNVCKSEFVTEEHKRVCPDDDAEFFVTRDMFTSQIAGYIYLITKKSTGEFYVGQTAYAPMFRWAEHMKTERFPISNILDYQFEVIEIVPREEKILEREKFWIQKKYLEHPELSLNVSQTQLLRKEATKDDQ